MKINRVTNKQWSIKIGKYTFSLRTKILILDTCVIRRFNSSVLRNVQYRIVTLWFPPFFLQNALKKRAATSIFLGTVARVVSQQFNKNLFVPGKNRWTERAESSRFSIVLCLGSATGEQRWKTKKKSLGSAKQRWFSVDDLSESRVCRLFRSLFHTSFDFLITLYT